MTGIPTIEPYPLVRELPLNTVGWRADPERAVLLIHDMQRYFLRPFAEELRARLVHNTALLRERCAELGVPVAYTAQPGSMTAEQRGLLKDFWGEGMTADEADRKVVEQLAPAERDWVLTKWRYSAFHGSDLLERIHRCGRDQLIVCGVYAHVGVLMTAVEAFTNDIESFFAIDAVADFSEHYHGLAANYAAERCSVVATVNTLLEQLGADAELHEPDHRG